MNARTARKARMMTEEEAELAAMKAKEGGEITGKPLHELAEMLKAASRKQKAWEGTVEAQQWKEAKEKIYKEMCKKTR
jgi:Zn-dependent oligopeptidase